MELLARYTAQGIPDDEIAILLGYKHTSSLTIVRSSPEYRLIFTGLTHKITTEIDLQASESMKELHAEIRNRIPAALRVFYDALEDHKTENRLKAAEKILSLDGRLEKNKSTEGQVNQFFLNDGDTAIADAIVTAVGKKK